MALRIGGCACGVVGALAAALVFGQMSNTRAQDGAKPPAQAPAGAAIPAATPAPAATPDNPSTASVFSKEELTKLLAPYALYPDELLAQLLPACAYPIDIVQVSRWLAKNKSAVAKKDFSGLDKQDWDPTVKALARFPDVIEKLNADLDATTDLGDAFVNQPDDVAAVIQELRRKAQQAGSLKTTKQQRVDVSKQGDKEYIVIQSADPGVIYTPTYDPSTVYTVGAGLIGFGLGVAVGAAFDNNYWDWNNGWAYPPRWPGYPGYRPGYPGYRPPGYGPGNGLRPTHPIAGGDINIGNDINIGGGNGNNIGGGNLRPWRPDPGRYRPGQGSKPGLAGGAGRPRPGTLPATGNRPGGGAIDRPQAGGGPAGGVARPGGGKAQRPGKTPPRAAQRPATKRPAAQRPAAKKQARNSAFGDARLNGASNAAAKRGKASRSSPVRYGGGPSFGGGGFHGGPAFRGGGGPAFRGGGGGGGRAFRGGGRGGGGRRGR